MQCNRWSIINLMGTSIVIFLLKVLGFCLSRLPKKVVRYISVILGEIVFYCIPARRHIALSNLSHAFPQKSEEWRIKICKESFHRMIELGMLSIACGFLTKKRIKKDFHLSPSVLLSLKSIQNNNRGAIILIPHTTLIESLIFVPYLLHDDEIPQIGVMYRSFDNKALERYIKKSRERFGLKLISRKRGFIEAMTMLKEHKIVAILFDQNAGCSGATTTFFGRFAQTTELPGILATRYHAPVYYLFAQRINTWEAEIKIEKLCNECVSTPHVLLTANQWLEKKLCSEDQICSDWLWAHNRWKITSNKKNLFSINKNRNWLEETRQFFAYDQFPKTFRVFIRLPNWLGDVVMAIPILRELERCRPDIEVTVLCQKHFIDFLEKLNLADHIIALPNKGIKYLFQIYKYRKLYPDVHIVLTNSLRGDLEAWIIGATVRLGIYNKHKRSPLLTDVFKFGPECDKTNIHQTEYWGKFLQAYGLTQNINYTPYKFCLELSSKPTKEYSIGLMCGSSNNPSKRWPLNDWKILIERLIHRYPGIQMYLYGSKQDIQITEKIALGFGKQNIQQECGTTTILDLCKRIQSNELIITCDSGGMHIANMFGKPVVCIFGPTNAIQTGPIFNAPKIIVRPPSCPSKGGFPIEDVSVKQVFSAVTSIMDNVFPVIRE